MHALFHVLVLHELKHDVALRRVRVKALIAFLVVVLKQYHGILTLGNLKVVRDAAAAAALS